MSGPRITGGRARGRPLPVAVPEGVRPTSSRVREALFSLVGHDLAGERVLDAFGGTGLLGLEAWSRGAEVVVVERDPAVAARIRRNAEGLGAGLDVRVGDVVALAPGLGRFHVVLADPPYRMAPGPLVEALAGCVGRVIVVETEAGTEVPDVAGLVLDRRRTYGGTALAVYRRSGG